MKKLIIFLYLLIIPSVSTAQFLDDFENYTPGGRVACQNPIEWTTWSSIPCDSVEDALISTVHPFGGFKSVLILQDNDLVKPLTSSSFISFVYMMVYIPNNKTGYFNLLSEFDPPQNVEWAMECYFNPGGQGVLITGLDETDFNFQYDTWYIIRIIIGFDNTDSKFWLNNDLLKTWSWINGGIINDLAAADFYGIENSGMYLDNFFFMFDYCLSCPPPDSPSNLAAEINISPVPKVLLQWQDNSNDEYIFEVLRKNGGLNDPGNYQLIGRVSLNNTNYIDTDVYRDSTYSYGVRAYSMYGFSDTSNVVTVTIDSVTIVSEVNNQVSFYLSQNYPNPFNPTTSLQYATGSRQYVTLKVYDLLGSEVAILVNEVKSAGNYEVIFDASSLPSGIYFYQLKAGEYIETKKMVFMK